jgi:DNA (cytosine-5)-methyltransferase 1
VKDALSNMPYIEQGMGLEEFTNQDPINEYQKLIYGIRNPGLIYNHRATKHSEIVVERYNSIRPGHNNRNLATHLQTKKQNVFRLAPDSPARTVTCNFRTDLIHPWIPRGLTVREAARLQGFDDDYCFFGNLTRKAKFVTQDDQVGNAVPPILAKVILESLKKYL